MKKATIGHPPAPFHITGEGHHGKSALAMAIMAALARVNEANSEEALYWLWPTDGRQGEYTTKFGVDNCFLPEADLQTPSHSKLITPTVSTAPYPPTFYDLPDPQTSKQHTGSTTI